MGHSMKIRNLTGNLFVVLEISPFELDENHENSELLLEFAFLAVVCAGWNPR